MLNLLFIFTILIKYQLGKTMTKEKTIKTKNLKCKVEAVVETSIKDLVKKGATLTIDDQGYEVLDLRSIK